MQKYLLVFFISLVAISSNAQPTAGLMAYWPMNGNFTDAGPNAITVTNNGATATTNISGNANGAMLFTNPTATPSQFARHNINANLNFSATQDFSVDFSFFLTSPYVHTCGLYDNQINYGGYGMWVWNPSGPHQIQFNFKNASLASTLGAVTLNTWYHICCLRSAGTLKIYINGVLNASGPEGTTTPAYNFPGRIGSMFYNAQTPAEYNPMHGKLDEFRIYNRALTVVEIQQLSSAALPVKLSQFTASYNNGKALLNWQTAFEQNSKHFIIQRSVDGVNFSNLSTVAAAGNAATTKNYNYNDSSLANLSANKKIFYRLQSVDLDGQFSLSKIIWINRDALPFELNISPNPAKDILSLNMGQALSGKGRLSIQDVQGKTWYQREMLPIQAIPQLSINISALPSGTYFLHLVSEQGKLTKSFIKN